MSSSKPKSNKCKRTNAKSKSPNEASKKIPQNTYFANEETAEIKSVLKVKDITTIPNLISATILDKHELVKTLLDNDHNVNETGPNNTTALIWAVKLKNVDTISLLLQNGGDPTVRTENGDNILVIALENKLWDENSFIDHLWNPVREISDLDVNFTSKNGHNMLHMCIRRDWDAMLKILLREKPDIDAPNSNGVTPLMLACFLNNVQAINVLIDSGAKVLKEDHHGRMTLCYAISSTLKSTSKPSSFVAIDKIIGELRRKSLMGEYIKRKLAVIKSAAKDGTQATCEMLVKIVNFLLNSVKEAIEVFLDCKIFQELSAAMEGYLNYYSTSGKFILQICHELLFYNEHCAGYNLNLYTKTVGDFNRSEMPKLCFEILTKSDQEIGKLAFQAIALSCNNECTIVNENMAVILLAYLSSPESNQLDENKVKIMRSKKRQLRKIVDNQKFNMDKDNINNNNGNSSKKVVPVSNNSLRNNTSSKNLNSKKSKQRTPKVNNKPVNKSKMKQQHNKTMDNISKRLNYTAKKITHSNHQMAIVRKHDDDSNRLMENPIIASLTNYLIMSEESIFEQGPFKLPSDHYPGWKAKILNSINNDFNIILNIDIGQFLEANEYLKCSTKFDICVSQSLNIVFNYLKQLIDVIETKYREYWHFEHMAGQCDCTQIDQHVPWLFKKHLKDIETCEKNTLHELYSNFTALTHTIRELARYDIPKALKAIYSIESAILNHEIRGIRLMTYVTSMENITIRYCTNNARFYHNQELVIDHVSNVLNDVEDPRLDLEIDVIDEELGNIVLDKINNEPIELYYDEMSQVSEKTGKRNKRREIESRLNTIANSYHLINSTMSICNDDGYDKKYGLSDLSHPLKAKCPPKSVHRQDEFNDYMPKRLKTQIATLQSLKTFQSLLNGEIRISSKEQRVNYVISAGINFNAVDLGLTINGKPLAVKRIQRESWLGKNIKTLVEPLLQGVRHDHILQYFACEYEENELILATPLCKFNLCQYVHLLDKATHLSVTQIVQQFLTGLMTLHKHDLPGPITHGNLKPSNIFIDFSGTVKVAEFGIYKALYKIIEAPKSSLMWFAKEMLETYKNTSTIDCTLKTDIQVAGMLIYYILHKAKHPYGMDSEEIIRNIEAGCFKLQSRNGDLKDLLRWMMSDEPNKRPNIDQVLGHPFFWSMSKKWDFVQTCAGISNDGFDVDKLHKNLDKIINFYIKIEDVLLDRTKYGDNDINSVTDLLKSIRFCVGRNKTSRSMIDDEHGFKLTESSNLAGALYRSLQSTIWCSQVAFLPFLRDF